MEEPKPIDKKAQEKLSAEKETSKTKKGKKDESQDSIVQKL